MEKVPIIIGSNRDEMAFFNVVERVPAKLTESEFDILNIGEDLQKVPWLSIRADFGALPDVPIEASGRGLSPSS